MSYQQLYDAFKRRFGSTLKPQTIQNKTNECWKELNKKIDDGKDARTRVADKVAELNIEATRQSSTFLNFFVKASNRPRTAAASNVSGGREGVKAPDPLPTADVGSVAVTGEVTDAPAVDVDAGGGGDGTTDKGTGPTDDDDEGPPSRRKRAHRTAIIHSDDSDPDDPKPIAVAPKQEQLKKEISITESELNTALMARDAGLLEGGEKTVKNIKNRLHKTKMALQRRQLKTRLERKYRQVRKTMLARAAKDNPNLVKDLRIRGSSGRPRLEDDQPDLIKAITQIALAGSGADARRRSEKIRTVRTLDDLHAELEGLGYTLSRSATYLRLLPRDWRTVEGRRHVNAAPVKLSRPQADLHKGHQDGKFCMATARSVETVASVLGHKQVCFISQDDKARVPLGITAATKQAPILMHTEYRVMLPDHDFVVGSRHKLVPSVMAGIVINDKKVDGASANVTYSGPTYVGIRSAKHNPSSAASHADDLRRVIDMDEFKDITKVDGVVKPVFIMSVDGGPDENPRYAKVIANAIDNFARYNMDAFYIFTNAPGRSAFNRVERRMAPLSKALSGVILEHDHFGTHLDSSNRTVDLDLEKKKFEHAGRVLSEIWGAISIDGHPVVAEFISDEGTATPPMPSPDWYQTHVRESQYLLQIVKCNEWICCDPSRSDIKHLLPDGFFPAPFPVRRTSSGLQVPEPKSTEETDEIPPLLLRLSLNIRPSADGFPSELPYDLYCPSVTSQLAGRSCIECGLYFSSKKNAETHKSQVHLVTRQRTKIRPKKMLRRRGEEVLCSVEDDGVVEVTWIHEDDVDEDDLQNIREEEEDAGMPLIDNIEDWLRNPWTEDLPDE